LNEYRIKSLNKTCVATSGLHHYLYWLSGTACEGKVAKKKICELWSL